MNIKNTQRALAGFDEGGLRLLSPADDKGDVDRMLHEFKASLPKKPSLLRKLFARYTNG